MTATARKRGWTLDDYSEFPGYRKIEMVDGIFIGPIVLERRLSPFGRALAELRLGRALAEHVFPRNLGLVGPGFGFVGVDGRNVHPPDLAFLPAAAIPATSSDDDRLCPNPPALAIDLLSLMDVEEWVATAIEAYLKGGVGLVWIVDPWQRSVTVHAADEPPRRLGPGDTLDGGDVLPAFALPVADVFA